MAVEAYTMYDDKESKKEEIDNFVKRLTQKYGDYSFKDDIFGTEYCWDFNDRIIRYTFKLFDSNDGKRVRYSDRFYIYKKEYFDKLNETDKIF